MINQIGIIFLILISTQALAYPNIADTEALKNILVRSWEAAFKSDGIRTFSGGQNTVFTHEDYPHLIFKTNSVEKLKAKAEASQNGARLAQELRFDKVVVPESILIEVWSDLFKESKLFLVEEKFDVPMDPFESEYTYGEYYKRFDDEPELKEYFCEMFEQLSELVAKLPGLWDLKANNLPLERNPTKPRMVLVDIEPSGREEYRLFNLFKGSNRDGAVAHQDFFEAMRDKIVEFNPEFSWDISWYKLKKVIDLKHTLEFRKYLKNHRAKSDAAISIDALFAFLLTPQERKKADFWIGVLNDQVEHLKHWDGKEFTVFSAPFLRTHYREASCSRNDKILNMLVEHRVIFSLQREHRTEYTDKDTCLYTFHW